MQNNFSLSQKLYNFFNDAWSKLIDPKSKPKQGDENISGDFSPARYKHACGHKRTKKQSDDTFWTVCPYCFYMHEYEKMYEDCCLRCQNCQMAFQAVVVSTPETAAGGDGGSPAVVFEGKEYHCGIGFFPLGYNVSGGGGNSGGKKAKRGGGEAENGKAGEVMQGKRNVKSVPRNSKKMAGRGVRIEGGTRYTAARRADNESVNVESRAGVGIRTHRGSGNGTSEGKKMEFIEVEDMSL